MDFLASDLKIGLELIYFRVNISAASANTLDYLKPTLWLGFLPTT
jgi:hypothetical protein